MERLQSVQITIRKRMVLAVAHRVPYGHQGRGEGRNTHDCDLLNDWTLNFLDLTEPSEETHSNMPSRSG